MLTHTSRSIARLAFGLLLLAGSAARAQDGDTKNIRIASVRSRYANCYGGAYHLDDCYCRPHCCEHYCPDCCCSRCIDHIVSPGGGAPSKCLDICLYRLVFPISPWASHPRDGILYPAYGSKSPTCP